MNSVINLDKPEDISSQQAVIKVKRVCAAKKAGHAGTLDPLATGVLIVCLDEATKITSFLSSMDKEYIVRLKLGERTDTCDSTGKILEKRDCAFIEESDIQETLHHFTGRITQTPPMYSAVKIGGQPLYKLARKGLHVERPARTIHVHRIDILSFHLPYVDLKVECSKGTYIRTLCDDVGEALGAGAHMVSLRRIRVGRFRIEDSVSIEELKQKEDEFHSMDFALSDLNEIVLDANSYHRAKNGVAVCVPMGSLAGENALKFENIYTNKYVRLKTPEGILFGIGRLENSRIHIERLLDTKRVNSH